MGMEDTTQAPLPASGMDPNHTSQPTSASRVPLFVVAGIVVAAIVAAVVILA